MGKNDAPDPIAHDKAKRAKTGEPEGVVLTLSLADVEYPIRVQEMTGLDSAQYRAELASEGLAPRTLMSSVQAFLNGRNPDLDDVCALLWLSRRQTATERWPAVSLRNLLESVSFDNVQMVEPDEAKGDAPDPNS
jgi:hypothetical protein